MNMKKVIILLAIVALAGCNKKDDFDENLLYGRWSRTGGGGDLVSYVFLKGGSGSWRHRGEIDTESLAWALSGSNLQITFFAFEGGRGIGNYIVKELTEARLRYEDADLVIHTFRKDD